MLTSRALLYDFPAAQLGRQRAITIASMKAFTVLFGACLAACNSSTTRLTPRPCPTHSTDSAVFGPVADQPKTREPFIPPLPIPSDVQHRRATIRIVVDTLGRAISDSITVCGIPNDRYTQRLAEAAAALRFRPRLVASRPIIAPTLFVYDF